jgi:hypothetical protein
VTATHDHPAAAFPENIANSADSYGIQSNAPENIPNS